MDKPVKTSTLSSDFNILCNNVDMIYEFDNLLEINVELFTTKLNNIRENQWTLDIEWNPKLRKYVN